MGLFGGGNSTSTVAPTDVSATSSGWNDFVSSLNISTGAKSMINGGITLTDNGALERADKLTEAVLDLIGDNQNPLEGLIKPVVIGAVAIAALYLLLRA